MNSADQFEAIVSDYYEPLFRFAMSLTRSESDAGDLTQQTFYIWATKGHQLHDFSKIKAWLFTTLHRTFLVSRRRQIRFPHHDLEEVSAELPVVSPVITNRSDSLQVLAALAEVDEVYQAAVALFYLEDCAYKDIALILDVPLGTVKSRIARGIMQLREILLTDGCRKPAAHCKNKSLPAPRPTQAPTGTALHGDDEWDFSATHPPEQPDAA